MTSFPKWLTAASVMAVIIWMIEQYDRQIAWGFTLILLLSIAVMREKTIPGIVGTIDALLAFGA